MGVAEGAADEHGGAVADVAGDERVGQGRLADVGEGGVDGVAEVEGGIDERAIKIKDQQAGRHTNHGASVAAPLCTFEGERLLVVIDGYVARTGADFERSAAAVDGAGEVMAGVVILLRRVGEADVDVTGAGRGFEIEVGVGGEVQLDVAGAGAELGCAGEMAVGLDIAGAAAGGEGSVEALDLDAAGAGFGFDIAGAGGLRVRCRRSRC